MKTLLESALARQNTARPPVWLMRQAGRYHSHYRAIRSKYSFIELCKYPEIACEVTMGPIRDFDFDAAILFSDLLFPLEAMEMPLTYDEGPKLGWHVTDLRSIDKLNSGRELVRHIDYQAEALYLIRKQLHPEKALLGFVGGPLTLFFYAASGSHRGDLGSAQRGMQDGRFEAFSAKLEDLLVENILLQIRAGADAVCVMDTCAGDIELELYKQKVLPGLERVKSRVDQMGLGKPLLYYSKKTLPAHWETVLASTSFRALGVDWNTELPEVLETFGSRTAIQGNISPEWMFLPPAEFERRVRQVFENVRALRPELRRGWVCGLGHGILPKTPEENVRRFVTLSREVFR